MRFVPEDKQEYFMRIDSSIRVVYYKSSRVRVQSAECSYWRVKNSTWIDYIMCVDQVYLVAERILCMCG